MRATAAMQTVSRLPQCRRPGLAGQFRDPLRRNGSRILGLFLVARARGAQPFNSRDTKPQRATLGSTTKFPQHFAAIAGLPPLVVVVPACAPQWCCQTDWTPDRDWLGSVFRAGSPGFFQKERPRGYYLPEPTLEGVLLRQELPHGDSSEAGRRVRRTQLVNGLWRLDSSCIELLDAFHG